MSGTCELSGKRTRFGKNVSFSKRRTNRTFGANVHRKRIYVPELGSFVRLNVSTHALRVIDKKGLTAYLRDEGLRLQDIVDKRRT
jgi:large subunit ribosomal protein L28